jgi:1,4-dihydroxy-2-naphthoate octaprenyltransferase
MRKLTAPVLVRALRLPFILASVLPYLAGAWFRHEDFAFIPFLLGLIAVAATHLSANVINDYADSRSGVDWQDRKYYDGFFGGSKLIQAGVLSESFYLRAAVICAIAAGASILALALVLRSFLVLILFILILGLSWAYSEPPLRLSYRGFGETAIFLLFGPVPVLAGHFIQTGRVLALPALLLAIPFGLLTTAILTANEVPDYPQDAAAGKHTLIHWIRPQRAYLLYYYLTLGALLAIAINIAVGTLSKGAFLSWGLLLPIFVGAEILRQSYSDKTRLVMVAKLTIAVQAIAGLIIILTVS